MANANSRPYRACYYLTPDGQTAVVLTGPEHSNWPDEELREEAVDEAKRGDIVYTGRRRNDGSRIYIDDLLTGLQIGPWED